MGFTSPEIDCIYPTNLALDFTEWAGNGVISIKTKGFIDTTSHKQSFSVNGNDVSVYFGISRISSRKIETSPLQLRSEMYFEFAETNDYIFILKIIRSVRMRLLLKWRNLFRLSKDICVSL